MTDEPLRALMSLLLSAVMLTGGSGLPSFCHSHVGGDRVHDHDCAAHQSDNPHSLDPKDDGHALCMTEAAVAHVHFHWLGFEFSLPLDSEDNGEDQPPPFLAPGCSPQCTALGSSSTAPVLHLHAEVAVASFPVVVEQLARRVVSQVSALPLCAKASHERSGVQVI